jgi:acetyl-CoA synthetase
LACYEKKLVIPKSRNQRRLHVEEAKKIVAILRDWVGKEIGPIAKPDDIRFGDNLPKTRSGKIMRRLLRTLAKGEEITSDISTLENPAILEQFKQIVS